MNFRSIIIDMILLFKKQMFNLSSINAIILKENFKENWLNNLSSKRMAAKINIQTSSKRKIMSLTFVIYDLLVFKNTIVKDLTPKLTFIIHLIPNFIIIIIIQTIRLGWLNKKMFVKNSFLFKLFLEKNCLKYT